tara:strand:- start:865 stop:1308 length:444 start_codon:yes stop_codon:yes gene_type:complete
MKKVLLGLVMAVIMTNNLFAYKTPNKLINNYFNDFNSGNISKVEKNFSFPLMVIQNGRQKIHKETSTFLNYKEIRKTGWSKSIINSVMLIIEKDKSAIVQVNFSRVNNKGDTYLTTDSNYILIKEDYHWYISGVIIDSDVPLGIENN